MGTKYWKGVQVRGKLYELLINYIPTEIILKRLLYELLRKLDAELKHEVCHWDAYYEHRMCLGQKAIFHIEGHPICWSGNSSKKLSKTSAQGFRPELHFPTDFEREFKSQL